MLKVKLKVKKLSENAVIPKYASAGAAGFDLCALNDVTIHPGSTNLISTGLSFEIPVGYELQIRPRSGLSLKSKLRIANSPGTIDSDYRGHVQIIAENTSNNAAEVIKIKAGDRIAQAVLSSYSAAHIMEEDEELTETERGDGGFGHTGGSELLGDS